MSTVGTEDGLGTGDGLGTAEVRAANALTVRWAAALGAAAGQGTVFSGAGVWPLLGLLATGADERGRAELGAAFGLDPAHAADAVRAVVDLFDRSPGLALALGLWRRADTAVRREWLDRLPPATRGVLGGDAAADQAALDAWAGEHTGGRITRMPVGLSPSIRLLLASALTVETTWLRPLKRNAATRGAGAWSRTPLALLTRESRGGSPEASWLAATEAGPVTVTVLEGSDDVDVYLFLGEENRAAADVLSQGIVALTELAASAVPCARWTGDRPAPGVRVTTTTNATGEPETRLECVGFEFSARHDLLAHAKVFGLRHAASPGDRFPGIGDGIELAQARQEAVAEFTETGFKAAALTTVAMRRMAMSRPLTQRQARLTTISYTRPFGFAAVHRGDGLVLVAGWVAQPRRP